MCGIINNYDSKKIINEIYFDPIFTIIGDFDLVIRISKNYKIGCIQLPLATYRKHLKNDSIINLDRQTKELNNWYNKRLEDRSYNKYDFSRIKNKLIFMKFEHNFNKNKIIEMSKLFFKQRDLVYLLKMILYIILPKFIVEQLKK